MAIGKNPNKSKYNKKGQKKKISDPFIKKDWYEVRAPAIFRKRLACFTPVNQTQGTKISSDYLKGRVIEVNLGDLNDNESLSFRKIQLRIEDVQGRNCLTNFHGMDFTTDKLRSIIRKWHTLIESFVDVKTTDGYLVRLFCIAQTRRRNAQIKKTAYAQSSQVRRIRKKMMDIMTKHATESDLRKLVEELVPEVIGKEIERACAPIFPLTNVFIRKAKVLKTPKFDITKLMELHTGSSTAVAGEDAGVSV